MDDNKWTIERIQIAAGNLWTFDEAAAFLAAYRECREIEREEDRESTIAHAREMSQGKR